MKISTEDPIRYAGTDMFLPTDRREPVIIRLLLQQIKITVTANKDYYYY